MDKRTLAAVGVAKATDEMMDLACIVDIYKYIAKAELICYRKILLLTFFDISELRKRKSVAVFRTFISKNDYITQDLRMSSDGRFRVKWITASFQNFGRAGLNFFGGYMYINGKCISNYKAIFGKQTEKDLVEKFLIDRMPSLKSEKYNTWEMLDLYQQEAVLGKRLAEKHKAEMREIDNEMKRIKKLPKKFYIWADEEALKDWRYVVYKPIGKAKAECMCTYCNSIYTVNRKEILIKNNLEGVCPQCGSKITFKALGRLAKNTHLYQQLAYIEKCGTEFVFRTVEAHRYIVKNKLPDIKTEFLEVQRTFYSFKDGSNKPVARNYAWKIFKNTNVIRWCNDKNGAVYKCMLYPYNLPKAWEYTPMKYSAVEILLRQIPTIPLMYERAIYAYCTRPQIEWVIKMGMYNLAAELIAAGNRIKYEIDDGKNIFVSLGISKEHTKVLIEVNGGLKELECLRRAEQFGIRLNAEQLKYLTLYFWRGETENIFRQAERKIASLHKILRYIEKESLKYTESDYATVPSEKKRLNMGNMLRDWIEYLEWCDKLGYDTGNRFYYMPNNFLKVHNRVAEEYRLHKEEINRKQMEAFDRVIKSMSKDCSKEKAFNLHKNGLFVRLPKNADEIKKEGETLHHCVGSYIDKVASGKTLIFFIRREAEPEQPYYTLEWKGRIEQCRGTNNRQMDGDVEKFANYFAKEMMKYSTKMVKNGEHN